MPEQRIFTGEVALHSSTLKRLSEEAARNPQNQQIQIEIKMLSDEIKVKNEQIASLEKQIAVSILSSQSTMDNSEMSKSLAQLMDQLNEKSFELEVKAADNRIIQDQLSQKICECEGLHEIIASLKQQLSDSLESRNLDRMADLSQQPTKAGADHADKDEKENSLLQAQATEIEELKQTLAEITESKEQLELRNRKLAEESSYAKGLASAAAVELKALSEEVAKLMNQNEKLTAEVAAAAAAKSTPVQRRTSTARNGRRESLPKRNDYAGSASELSLKRELAMSREREVSYEAALQEKDQREAELQTKVEESKQREAYLENELANMWVLVAKLKKASGTDNNMSESPR